MSLLALILLLVCIGIGLYCINRFVPMDATVKRILNIVVIIVIVLLLLQAFGVLDELRGIRVPRI